MGLYSFIEALCNASTLAEEAIVSQWGPAAIIIEPGDDPLNIYSDVRTYFKNLEN